MMWNIPYLPSLFIVAWLMRARMVAVYGSCSEANDQIIMRIHGACLPVGINSHFQTIQGNDSVAIFLYPPQRSYIGFSLSVCLSVCPSVCPLTFRVRPVASTVPDGFFPYLVQMITSMRRCVACDDLWPWLISSRSFDLDLENRVRSVASTVLDGFLLYLAQIIFFLRGCVASYLFIPNLEIIIFGKFLKFFGLDLEKKILQFSMDSFHIYHKWSLVWEGVLHIMTFDLDLYLQGH